jgi:hypothetical protein
MNDKVLQPSGPPFPSVTVRAFNKDLPSLGLRGETQLGTDAATDADGSHNISFTVKDLQKASANGQDKLRPDLFTRAFDGEILLGQSVAKLNALPTQYRFDGSDSPPLRNTKSFYMHWAVARPHRRNRRRRRAGRFCIAAGNGATVGSGRFRVGVLDPSAYRPSVVRLIRHERKTRAGSTPHRTRALVREGFVHGHRQSKSRRVTVEARHLDGCRYCGSGRGDRNPPCSESEAIVHALAASLRGASVATLTDEEIGFLLRATGVRESRLEDPLLKSKDETDRPRSPEQHTGRRFPSCCASGRFPDPRSACRIPQLTIGERRCL